MKSYVKKTQDQQKTTLSQEQNTADNTFQLMNNQPAAQLHTQLQENMNNSPQMLQMKTMQELASNNQQEQQVAQLQSAQGIIQRQEGSEQGGSEQQENKTGLPDNLKSGVEALSGISMDDTKVHYNSDKPAQLQAHAYAQGNDIHLASGQEKHLPHEAWHIVQQKQGRVKPTTQLKGKVNINDDQGLEHEADVMGQKALQMQRGDKPYQMKRAGEGVAQLEDDEEIKSFINTKFPGTLEKNISLLVGVIKNHGLERAKALQSKFPDIKAFDFYTCLSRVKVPAVIDKIIIVKSAFLSKSISDCLNIVNEAPKKYLNIDSNFQQSVELLRDNLGIDIQSIEHPLLKLNLHTLRGYLTIVKGYLPKDIFDSLSIGFSYSDTVRDMVRKTLTHLKTYAHLDTLRSFYSDLFLNGDLGASYEGSFLTLGNGVNGNLTHDFDIGLENIEIHIHESPYNNFPAAHMKIADTETRSAIVPAVVTKLMKLIGVARWQEYPAPNRTIYVAQSEVLKQRNLLGELKRLKDSKSYTINE